MSLLPFTCACREIWTYLTNVSLHTAEQCCAVAYCNHSTTAPASMECSQPAEWTMNRSLLMVSCVKAFPVIRTNSDPTQSCVIGSHWCITSHPGSAPASCNIPPGFAVHHLHLTTATDSVCHTSHTYYSHRQSTSHHSHLLQPPAEYVTPVTP